MFQIKICGITSAQDARAAALAGADAIGLNFYERSRRFVEVGLAEQIVEALPAGVAKVGVFVNADPQQIARIADRLRLDHIQLHGDERPEAIRELERPRVERPSVVRAFRCGEQGFAAMDDYLQRCRIGRRLPDAVLVDAHQPGHYGGTGKVVDWDALVEAREVFGGLPLILAGGLTPFNVAEAIPRVEPAAVDTASGVESSPGRKDPALLGDFVRAAKKAFGLVRA